MAERDASNPDPTDAAIDDQEFERLRSSRRRRGLIAGGLAAVVVVTIALVVARKQANKLPALDADEVRKVEQALDMIPADQRVTLAAAALVELEQGRLPDALVEPFEGLVRAPPEMAGLLLLAPFAEQPDAQAAWLLACPDGASILSDAATRAPGEAAKLVFDRCELGRLGLLGDGEVGGASLGALVATHAVWAYLGEHGSQAPVERRLLRTVMGRGR